MTASLKTSGNQQAEPRTGMWLGMSVVAAIGCAALGFISPAAFWSGYLVAGIFWLSISSGCLAISLIHGTTGGRWGQFLGRPLHAGISTLWYSLAVFCLIALGAHLVFPWANAETAKASLNENQQIWLAPSAVAIRYLIIGAIWLVTGAWLNRRYRMVIADPKKQIPQSLTGLGILMYFITFSIISVDFMMALTPAWASSMYPMIRIMNCGVSALALCAIVKNVRLLHPTRSQIDCVHDIGNLLQAFNLLWTYTSFSQYILIWTGDIAGEVEWYMERRTPFWMVMSLVLFALHFVLPFLLLLARNAKRGPKYQNRIAVLLLVMCIIDIAWTLLPSIPVAAAPAMLSVFASVVAIGGIWMIVFQRAFDRLPEMAVTNNHGHTAEGHHAVEQAAGEST